MPDVRVRAATALSESGRPEAIDALVAATRDPHDWVRYTSARGLVHFSSDDRAIHALVQWLERENSTLWGPASFFDALVEIKGPAAPHLVRLLAGSIDRARWRAAVWLARIGDAAAADTLAAFLEADGEVPSSEAALVLKDLGRLPAGSNHDPDSLVEAVLGAGGSIRVAAAWALGLIGDSRSLPVLLELVTNAHDTGSIIPALERCLTHDAARATETDLRAAATLSAPGQVRWCGPDGWFGPGQWLENLEPLNLDRVHQFAQTELLKRGLAL